jgi:hypothetical protein
MRLKVTASEEGQTPTPEELDAIKRTLDAMQPIWMGIRSGQVKDHLMWLQRNLEEFQAQLKTESWIRQSHLKEKDMKLNVKAATQDFSLEVKKIKNLWVEREQLIIDTFIKAFEINQKAFDSKVQTHRDESWSLIYFTIRQEGDLKDPSGYYGKVESDLGREAWIHFNADFSKFNVTNN